MPPPTPTRRLQNRVYTFSNDFLQIASNVCDILLTLCEKNVTKLEPEDYVTVIYVLLEHGGLNHEEKRSVRFSHFFLNVILVRNGGR